MLISKIKGLEEFEHDSLFQQFLADDFDVKAVTSSAVQLSAVAEHLTKLSAGIALLDKALHHQVSNHYEDLLSQATEIETFEGVLLSVHQQIQSLLLSADKLRSKIVEPYEAISGLTRKLRRLHIVCDLLRKMVRVVRLCRRLETQLARRPPEGAKIANCLSELDEIDGLEGIKVLEYEREIIIRARSFVLQNGINVN